MMKRMRMVCTICAAVMTAGFLASGCKSSDTPAGPGGGGGGTGLTVVGKVLGQNNQPVAGVPVLIKGIPSTNTDANGNFTFTNVSAPYDVTVIDGTGKTAFMYKGVTRTDPTLSFLGMSPGTPRNANITGKVFGGAFSPTQPADHTTQVAFISPEAMNNTTTAADGTFGPMGINWASATTTTGALYALQFQRDGAGLPVASGFKGYGVRNNVVLTDANPLINQFDTLQAIGTGQMTGTVSVASGYTVYTKVIFARVSANGTLRVFSDNTPTTNFSYYTPNITGVALILGAGAQKTGNQSVIFKTGLSANATGLAVSVPAAPEQSLPIAGATGVDTTVAFSWTAYTGGVHLVYFQAGGTNPKFYILTSGTSATIPNLQPFGLGLPPSTTYTWQIYGFAPYASVDAAAAPGGFLAGLLNPALLGADSYLALSASRNFVTKP
ncbi:MAG: carboxypeptidase-like regulatory domain-containing protein [Bacteroidota bacterium]